MAKVPSKAYWIKRAERTLIENEKAALEYETQLASAYEETIARIQKEVEAFYGRYAKDQKIDLAETRHRLDPKSFRDFQHASTRYLSEVNQLGDKAFTEGYRKYLKELSGKAYITKMNELVTNIRHHIETLSTGYNIGLGQTLSDAYEDGYFRTMFDAQLQSGFGISFTSPGGKSLEMAVREKWNGQNYSDRIWADKDRLLKNLEPLLSQQFVMGKGPREVSKALADKMGTSFSNARRLIRTEINYISNKGSIKAYADSEVVQEYEYVATLDMFTSDICRAMDGKIFKLNEARVGITLPPLHPHCRSTTIPHFPDDEISNSIEDRIASGKDGKTYKLGKDMTFEEWAKEHASDAYYQRVSKNSKRYKSMDEEPFFYGSTDTSEREPDNSLGQYTNEDGTLTEERELLHQHIIDHLFKGITPTDKPIFTMMGGGPASGKSTMIKAGAAKLPDNSVMIDSDGIKELLPDYAKMVKNGDRRAAAYVHEESSAIAKRVMNIANKKGYSYVLDGTGDGSISSLEKKIKAAKEAGHYVEGIYATVPTEIAIERATKRAAETGREVPLQNIRDIHHKVSIILPECAKQFDSVRLFDTSDGAVLIASGGNGEGLKAIEGKEAQFDEFMAKGR